MKKEIYIGLIFILISFADNGDQELFMKHFECLNLLNPQIPKEKWNLEQQYDEYDDEYYSFYMEKMDTVYNITFLFKDKKMAFCDSKYFIIEFLKRYSDGDFNYVLKMDTDTLYFYQQSKKTNELNFIMGKYYYLYNTPKEVTRFKQCQDEYFQNHIDSLTKVRGNDLPELPCY